MNWLLSVVMAEVTAWHRQIKLLECWVFHESWLPAAQLFCRCGAGRSHPLISYRAASSAFEMSSRLWVFFKDVSWSSGYTPKSKWIKSPCDDLLVTPAVYIPMLIGWSFTANGSDRIRHSYVYGKKRLLWCCDVWINHISSGILWTGGPFPGAGYAMLG